LQREAAALNSIHDVFSRALQMHPPRLQYLGFFGWLAAAQAISDTVRRFLVQGSGMQPRYPALTLRHIIIFRL
jgi:hypothetical protein